MPCVRPALGDQLPAWLRLRARGLRDGDAAVSLLVQVLGGRVDVHLDPAVDQEAEIGLVLVARHHHVEPGGIAQLDRVVAVDDAHRQALDVRGDGDQLRAVVRAARVGKGVRSGRQCGREDAEKAQSAKHHSSFSPVATPRRRPISNPPTAPRPSRSATPAAARAIVSLESPSAAADVPEASDVPLLVGTSPPFSPVATSTGSAASLSLVTEAGNSLPGGPIHRTTSPFP